MGADMTGYSIFLRTDLLPFFWTGIQAGEFIKDAVALIDTRRRLLRRTSISLLDLPSAPSRRARKKSRPAWVRNIVQMHLNDIALRIENLSIQYAEVYGINRSADWALLKLTEEVGELAQAHLTATGQGRNRGLSPEDQQQVVANELGDVLGMCLVYAKQLGIEPEVAIAEKWFRHEKVPAASAD